MGRHHSQPHTHLARVWTGSRQAFAAVCVRNFGVFMPWFFGGWGWALAFVGTREGALRGSVRAPEPASRVVAVYSSSGVRPLAAAMAKMEACLWQCDVCCAVADAIICLQGRVRTKTVKKAARVLIEKYYARLTMDFQLNKKIAEEVAIIPSKRLRNKIAGFTTVSFGPPRDAPVEVQTERGVDAKLPQVCPRRGSTAWPGGCMALDGNCHFT